MIKTLTLPLGESNSGASQSHSFSNKNTQKKNKWAACTEDLGISGFATKFPRIKSTFWLHLNHKGAWVGLLSHLGTLRAQTLGLAGHCYHLSHPQTGTGDSKHLNSLFIDFINSPGKKARLVFFTGKWQGPSDFKAMRSYFGFLLLLPKFLAF